MKTRVPRVHDPRGTLLLRDVKSILHVFFQESIPDLSREYEQKGKSRKKIKEVRFKAMGLEEKKS